MVARLSTDTATAWKIDDAFAESLVEVVTSSFEEPDGSWSLALHFRERPEEALARALIARVAGPAAAEALAFETLAPTDWVTKGLDGLTPVEAGRFVVHGKHHRMRVPANLIAIEIEASLAFGTGHHGTTRGCLIALDRNPEGTKTAQHPRHRHRHRRVGHRCGEGAAPARARQRHRRPGGARCARECADQTAWAPSSR